MRETIRDLKKRITELEKLESENKRLLGRMQRSEQRYKRLFQTAKDGILIVDGDTDKIIDINPYLKDMLGYPRSYFIGKELWEIGMFEDRAASRNAFKKLQSREYIRYENLPLEKKSSRKMEVEFVSNVYYVGDKRIIQCNIRDITERKQSLAKLKEDMGEMKKLNDILIDRELVVDELKRRIKELEEDISKK